MRIESLELLHCRLPLVHPFETSFGREVEKDTVVLRIRADGIEGFGEAPVAAAPGYSAETVETCWSVVRDWMGPPLVGSEIGPETDVGALWPKIRGHHMARAGIEAALWDLRARAAGEALAGLYAPPGERPAETIPAGVSVGIQSSPEKLVERVREHVEAGYRRVKVKVKRSWDVEVVARVREAFPALPLGADANGDYGPEDIPRLRELDALGLLFLEQPFAPDDIASHARLQAEMKTMVCLDESVPSLEATRSALDLGAGRMVNLKPARVGGITRARRVRDLCRERGVPLWCGGLLESGIGRLHNVAMAAGPGFTHPGDISGSKRYVAEDVIEPPVEVGKDGMIRVPTRPGLGHAVREDVLKRYALRRLRIA